MTKEITTYAQDVIIAYILKKLSPCSNMYWDELYNESTQW